MNHQFWLTQIKRSSGASFVGWETEKGVTRLKLISEGVPQYINLTGTIDNVTEQTYLKLLQELEND